MQLIIYWQTMKSHCNRRASYLQKLFHWWIVRMVHLSNLLSNYFGKHTYSSQSSQGGSGWIIGVGWVCYLIYPLHYGVETLEDSRLKLQFGNCDFFFFVVPTVLLSLYSLFSLLFSLYLLILCLCLISFLLLGGWMNNIPLLYDK